ncbi:MAG: DegT/DnrJ/EryC1/StrS family aminotransferase [Tannerella sp.]|jgi:dTDP-4-amino-4,6-dideoxygalactose transaminase|nr:DegT/DnrJ/EryC1/StrS family aminotransferase [Tannerella sp.]
MHFIDLQAQYLRLKDEIDAAVQCACQQADYINGSEVKDFTAKLSEYLNVPYIVTCGNCTDALRIALQALNIGAGDEVIVPAFTYIAPVEAIAAVGATPVLVDVDANTFNINTKLIENAISNRTKAIIAVHLFGQSSDTKAINEISYKHKLSVIEDNAQSLGADIIFKNGKRQKAGTTGTIGVTSFFPTKPLGCFGDGGALFTHDAGLSETIRLLANHGQSAKYHHKTVGSNSRLDNIQAAILNIKLRYMEQFTARRRQIAAQYTEALKNIGYIQPPVISPSSTHVFHQYTIQVGNGRRDALKAHLAANGIPTMVYYPLPIHEQEAYKHRVRKSGALAESERLTREVLSLPIDPEMTNETVIRIIEILNS